MASSRCSGWLRGVKISRLRSTSSSAAGSVATAGGSIAHTSSPDSGRAQECSVSHASPAMLSWALSTAVFGNVAFCPVLHSSNRPASETKLLPALVKTHA